jgi:hypothetical protein
MSACAIPDDPRHTLPLDVLEDAAEMLARGRSWEDIAATVQWDVRDLKRAAREDVRFLPLVVMIEEENRHRAEGEMLCCARAGFGSEDGKERAKAIDSVAKYLASIHRDETRLKVAEINNQAKLAVEQLRTDRARAKAGKGEEPEPGPEAPPLTPEQEAHHWDCERRSALWNAELVAREKGVMFLWGGCHKLGSTPPDDTDTPLQVFFDHTLPRHGQKGLIWAVPTPTPVPDAEHGPFLAPPGCRPAVCPTRPEGATASGAA